MKKSCKSAKQEIRRFMWSLERRRLMIQKASEDVTEGGIMFPSFKTSYIEENTKTGEKYRNLGTEFTMKCLCAFKKSAH